jgi:hypothetical protein
MTIVKTAEPRRDAAPAQAVGQLARIEAGRMLRHPAPWLGLAVSAWWLRDVYEVDWASAHYDGQLTAVTPLLLGVSLASVHAFGRERVAVADDAPLEQHRRSLGRLLGGLALVGLVALVVAAGATWLWATGGVRLGDQPGRTDHAMYTAPELLQPVLLAALAVALGAAVVHLVRQRLLASILLVVWWFLVGGTYWMFQGDVSQWLTPLQVQPVLVEVAPAATDPSTFPSEWLLSAPGEYQDFWGRLVVSPSMAAGHDLYLVGLTLLAVAVAVPGRVRRLLLGAGAVVAVGAVLLQAAVAP